MPLLKVLRTKAVEAMAGKPPFDQPIQLTLRVLLPRQNDPSSLASRRLHGDLDNFITGVCDGLQKAHPGAFAENDWLDVPAAARPAADIAFTDDSWVRAIRAELLHAENSVPAYEVEIEPLG
jgi:hypothetical protein